MLVDDKIYDSISSDVSRYASNYIQGKLSDTKALVMPLDLDNISAYDIHRMMENIYFDGLENVNSSLIWLVMIWDIPLPVINQDGYVFPSVYPYVDFENQKYVRDADSQYFVPNGNPNWQAEIWHWLINYWSDSVAYTEFFAKIQRYLADPDEFIWDSMWYEDFIAQEEWFLNNNFQYYKNRIIFSEDLGYQRYSPLMKNLIASWASDEWIDSLLEINDIVWGITWINEETLQSVRESWSQNFPSTKMVQQEIKDGYLADYNNLFSQISMTTQRDNVFAGSRWLKTYTNASWEKAQITDVDSTPSLIKLKDDLYLWNDDLEWVIQNLNDMMEEMIDKKIEDEKYSMDIVIPVEYEKVEWKKARLRCFPFTTRYENFYFWKSARYVEDVLDLSIYRWTYRNLENLEWITYDSLNKQKENQSKSAFDSTDLQLKSVWASYDIFSTQAEWNRWYVMTKVQDDLELYEENKVTTSDNEVTECVKWARPFCAVKRKTWPTKYCGDEDNPCEWMSDFAQRWWWWASAINLNSDSISDFRYVLSGYKATDARRSIYDMGGYQSVLPWNYEWTSWTWWITWTWVWPQWDATNYNAYEKYASPTQLERWDKKKFRWYYRIYENHSPTVHIPFNEMNYRDLDRSVIVWWNFNQESDKLFTVEKSKKWWLLSCKSSEKYTYKFVSSVAKHTSTTDDEINGIDFFKYGEDGTLWRYYADLARAYSWLNQEIDDAISSGSAMTGKFIENWLNLDMVLSGLNSLLIEYESVKDSENQQAINEVENKIQNSLFEIQKIREKDKSDFLELYMQIWSLFADNILSQLQHIIHIEWWDATNYIWATNKNLSKIQFLPEWMKEINQLHTYIESKWGDLSKVYADAYAEVNSHVRDFNIFVSSNANRFPSPDQVNSINSEFNKMFIFEMEDDDEGVREDKNPTLELTWGSVESIGNDLKESLDMVKVVYSNLVEEDKAWPAIVSAAKSDSDFLLWLYEKQTWEKRPTNSMLFARHKVLATSWAKSFVTSNQFSNVDWIREYALWAKWDGYDSQWAKKNYELLNWVVEHMSGMNILTPDRPIDSPHYVSMQSIAEEEIKLIYPDLFKVEVFKIKKKADDENPYDVHELLTWWKIKENIVKYLKWKVNEYNLILKNQYEKAIESDIYYNKFARYNPLATPIKDKSVRPYNYFTYEDFLEAIGWEEMLDVIANTLYYQNMTNKTKFSTWIVADDLGLIDKSFSLNDKRKLVLEDYLVEWNEKLKNVMLDIPTYQITGYEVAYINSDGWDYIVTDTEIIQDIETRSETDKQNKMNKNQNKVVLNPTQQESDLKDKCNIPANGTLPLFKLWSSSDSPTWLEWFACWWKQTKQEPLKIKLKFDNALWQILTSSWLKEFIKETVEEPFSQWWNAMDEYADKRDVILDPWTWYDAAKQVTDLWVEAELHNRELYASNHEVGLLLKENMRITNSNWILSDNDPTSLLEISSVSDIWNVKVEFIWTGDGCIQLSGNDNRIDNICPWTIITKSFNPKTNPYTWEVKSSDHVAGSDWLDIKVHLWGVYIEKVFRYEVSPTFLDHAEIILWDEKTIAWMISPVEVIAYDKYENRISWTEDKYDFTVSQWEFLKNGIYQTWFKTNDFRDLRFYYRAPLDAENGSEAIIKISKSEDILSNQTNEVLATYPQKIVQAAPEVRLNGNTILKWKNDLVTNQSYRLKNDESIYNGDKLDVSKLQKLDVYMYAENGELIDVDSQIMVTSKKWLVVVWQVQPQENWGELFFESTRNYMASGHATIYYYPTTVAWDEVIEIDIPWLDTRVINLSIKPAGLYDVLILPDREILEIGDSMTVEMFLTDIWWNMIDGTRIMEVSFDCERATLNWTPCPFNVIEVTTQNGYAKMVADWVDAWMGYFSAGNGYATVTVDQHLLPTSWLNVMYLNYFWDDWWNQWWYFSKNNKHVEYVMKKSNKIITTTTQLVSEKKIKKMLWKADPWFQIRNPWGLDTVAIIKEWKLNTTIGDASNALFPLPSAQWKQVNVDTLDNVLKNEKLASENYIFYIASDTSYTLSGWAIYSGEELIAKFEWDVTLKLSSNYLENGNNIWNVMYKWENYWNLVFHVPWYSVNKNYFDINGDYKAEYTFTDGSTYRLSSVWIFDGQTDFELDISYKSIQNSNELDEKIWFMWDFKNITLFGEWEIVGEATKKFWSELLINLWDPVLSRKDKNEEVYGTKFDGWVWKEIYVDYENDIFKTFDFDFNNDGLDDLLVVYLDGSVKLAKNYGWEPDLRDMQQLMHIAVDIKDVYVWDVDGNKYSDIIVYTQNNQLRTYLNKGWIFDVDGNVACLNTDVHQWEVSQTPSDLSAMFQIFVDDMDGDNIVDVVTYDNKWYIKIFYGWSTNWYANYLSKEKYACDDEWYTRESPNINVVDALWVQVTSERIYDNSMLHWVWMSIPDMNITEAQLPEYGITFKPNELEKLVTAKTKTSEASIQDVTEEIFENVDMDKANKKFIDEWLKFQEISLFENELVWWSGKTYVFAPLSYLDPNDPSDRWSAWKTYSVKSGGSILSEWDIVEVTVTIKASDLSSFRWAFADNIQWPWKVYFNDKNIFKGIEFITDQKWAEVKQKDGNFAYIVDNIILAPGEKMVFKYELEYTSIPLRQMSISRNSYRSPDLLPDIKMQSTDWCEKDFDAYVNQGWRKFIKWKIWLQAEIDKQYEDEDENTENQVDNARAAVWNVNSLPGLVWDKIDRVKMVDILKDSLFTDDDHILDLNLALYNEELNKIDETIDEIMEWMCNGFSFGWSNNCEWLPVPFNQAFLAPGKYHLFGCRELPMWKLENWLPVFFFPGNLTTPVGVLPIPNAQKWVRDGFVWIPWWTTWNSWIRIYAAPTLTAQLWIAVCMWDYSVWTALKSPFADVGGNCVVFAVKPQCSKNNTDGDKNDPENPNETFELIIEEVRDSGVCTKSQKWPTVTEKWGRSSPFNMYSYSSSRKNFDLKWTIGTITRENKDTRWGENNQLEFSANFMWIIDLETRATIGTDREPNETKNSIIIWDVDVLWWDYDVNKIKWWIQQWIRNILIDGRLDPQIRYILNQLTKMHVNIRLPNMVNLIGNEITTINNVATNFSTNYNEYRDGINDYAKNFNEFSTSTAIEWSWTKWDFISQEILNKANSNIANPFEALASMMNQSNIINISTEPITVKIPMIFAEDINAYDVYLKLWLTENQKILDKWEWILSSLWTKCSTISDPTQKDQCYKDAESYMASFIEFQQTDRPKMKNQIYANIMVLQKYRNFPFEIYEWIHVIDRYMSELASLISNTIWYLSYWTSVNAERFAWYVDAIVLMFNIIKTYQMIIDFSKEWSQNCGNCARDTYDQYSCKLSLLCNGIQLPIIQIPNFKLPNITIDLTDIDLWLDIILPEFNFQWVRIDLPDFPNLPEPPSIWANIKLLDLPDIPILPEPPELPELPSFIPEVEIELPILPPAPEIPKIPNQIEALVKFANLVWKIYCIVKWNFGMVGESSVKAKIEQLTQRTYKVDWIDDIMDFTNRTVAPIKNYGVDYEISAHVDMQFNFSDIYNYLDVLTDGINNLTTSAVRWVNDKADTLYDAAINPLDEMSEKVESANLKIKATGIDLDHSDWDEWIIKTSMADIDIWKWLETDEIEYVKYDEWKQRLQEVLAYIRSEFRNESFANKVNENIWKMENQINSSNEVKANNEWLSEVEKEVKDYLDSKKVWYDQLADLINNDYDKFLAMVETNEMNNQWTKSETGSWKVLAFNVDLFKLGSNTKENIQKISKQNPYEMLLDNKKEIVDGYRNAINTNTADDLWLTNSQYLVLRNNISNIRNEISGLYSVLKPIQTTNLIAKNESTSNSKTLLSANSSAWIEYEMKMSVDPSSYSNWVYEKIVYWKDTWKRLANVVYSDEFTEKIWNNYFKTNYTQNHDIVLWTDNAVYRKCYDQNCGGSAGGWGKYYMARVKEIPYKETWLKFSGDTKLKIADWDVEVKGRKVWSQNYDTLSFYWRLSDVDAYLIKLVERIDNSYEKQDYTNKSTAVRYVLALPDGVEIDEKTQVELLINSGAIKDLVWKDIAEIVYYDRHKSSATVVISEVERKWYYARIATLKLVDDRYEINSPWSNQIVAGKQIVWDDQHPLWDALLYRPSTLQVVSEWDDLEWYVWTKYELIVNWKDNVALSYINITQDGKILAEKYTLNPEEEIKIEWLFNTKNEKHIYETMWIDQFWNKTQKEISVSYYIPEVTIVDIEPGVYIEAELSQDIDHWNLTFQRRRNDEWKSMQTMKLDIDFTLEPRTTTVRMWPYKEWSDIVMRDANDEVVATINPDTAEIVIEPWSNYEVNATVEDSLVIHVCNKNSKKDTFDISLPVEEIVKIEAEWYTVSDIPSNGWMWKFNGWKAIHKDGNNVMIIAPSGHLYSELWVQWSYAYDMWMKALMFTFYQNSDLDKKYPIKIWLRAEPLMK